MVYNNEVIDDFDLKNILNYHPNYYHYQQEQPNISTNQFKNIYDDEKYNLPNKQTHPDYEQLEKKSQSSFKHIKEISNSQFSKNSNQKDNNRRRILFIAGGILFGVFLIVLLAFLIGLGVSGKFTTSNGSSKVEDLTTSSG